jgi:hypothetical protein
LSARHSSPWNRNWVLATLAGALCAAIMVIFFWRVLAHGESFGDRDLAGYYHPVKSIIAPLARASGGIPLWNPFFGSGQPFAANPEHEVFCSLTTLFFLLPFEIAYCLQVIVPLPLAVVCMFVFLRTLRRSRPAALFGGLSWGFGGYLLSNTNLLPILFAVASLPLTLAFVVRVARKPRLVDVAALSLCFGVQCLAGEPSTLLATPLLGLAAALAQRTTADRRYRSVLALVAAFVLGAALGGATLVPGLHHAGKTDRAIGIDKNEALSWSTPPVRLLELVVPHVLGHVEPSKLHLYWGGSLYGEKQSPYFYSIYPGLAASLLAIGAAGTRRRLARAWMVVAVLGVLLALGSHFPLWPSLRRLPGLAGIRFPEKFVLLLLVPVIVAASLGFDQTVMGPAHARRWLLRLLGGFVVLGVVGAVVIWLLSGRFPADFPWRQARFDALNLAAVALTTLSVLHSRIPLKRPIRGLVLCIVLTLDLVSANRDVIHTQPLSKMAGIPQALMPLVTRAEDDLLFHAAAWHPQLADVDGMAKPPMPARWGVATTLEADYDHTFLRATNRATALFWKAVQRQPVLMQPLLQRRGVTAILRFRPEANWQGDFVVGGDGGSALDLVTGFDTQPPVFAAQRVEIVDGDAGWLDAVLRLGPEVRQAAIVDHRELAAFPGSPAPATVHVRERTPVATVLDVEAQGPGPSFLAFNQTWDEGWRATCDGVALRWLRSDVSLSGVVVPPGRHRIDVFYEDDFVTAGVTLSVLAALAALMLLMLGRFLASGGLAKWRMGTKAKGSSSATVAVTAHGSATATAAGCDTGPGPGERAFLRE